MTRKDKIFNPDGQHEITLTYETEERSLWASQKQMAEMYGITVATINEHIKTIERESGTKATIRKFRIVQKEGNREVKRDVAHYHHKIVLVVGFHCHSPKAYAFQEWATDVLFRELMQEKRDEERDSYKVIKRALCMATDYSPNVPETSRNFAIMQDMMHYATAGATATDILIKRANVHKKHMGLTTFAGKTMPTTKDVTIAKNYLTDEELEFMTNLAIGFTYSIQSAIAGPNKHQYTMKEVIEQFKQHLIMYHQNVLPDAMGRIIRREDADRHVLRLHDQYKRLMQTKLGAIQSGAYYKQEDWTSGEDT